MSKEQEYQEKLEIIKNQLGIDYLNVSIFEFEREVENLKNEVDFANIQISNLESKIEDLEDEIDDLENENKKLKEQLKNKT